MAQPYSPSRVLEPKDVLQGAGNPVSLENVIVDTLVDGSLCYVRDVDDIYVLEKFSTVPVSAPNVIATIKGAAVPGRWRRYTSAGYYQANWAVTDWYIDGSVGNDTNSGTSIANPLRTGAELVRRLGPYALWSHAVTIHVGIGGMSDALIVQGAILTAGDVLQILGTPILQASAGTVATYSGVNHATAAAPQITSSLVADWTAYAGMRLRITSGANAGAVSWVARSNPGGAGVGTARTSRWSRISTTSTATLLQNIAPVLGDPVFIETLPNIPAITLRLDGPIVGVSADPIYDSAQFIFDSIRCSSIEIDSTANGGDRRCYMFGCDLGVVRELNRAAESTIVMQHFACKLSIANTSFSIFLPVTGDVTNSLAIGDGTAYLSIYNGVGVSLTGNVHQGMGIRIHNGAYATPSDFQIFGMTGTNDALQLSFSSGIALATGISGSENNNYGWQIPNCVNIRIVPGTTLNLSGTAGQVRLIRSPATTITQAQLAAAGSDFAHSGVATLPGATNFVDVAISYWDPSIQRAAVTRRDLGGAAGDLSAPSANRTATNLRIQSASATDTSTVDWQLSPSGRNIFISS